MDVSWSHFPRDSGGTTCKAVSKTWCRLKQPCNKKNSLLGEKSFQKVCSSRMRAKVVCNSSHQQNRRWWSGLKTFNNWRGEGVKGFFQSLLSPVDRKTLLAHPMLNTSCSASTADLPLSFDNLFPRTWFEVQGVEWKVSLWVLWV